MQKRERPAATPEEIWGILREVAEDRRRAQEEQRRVQEEQRRAQEEQRRAQEEQRRAQEEQREEQREEAERIRKEADARLRKMEGIFIGQWGKLMESLVEGDLVRLLRERGVDVNRVTQRLSLKDDPRQREIDLLAWNGTEIVVVEVKTTLKVRHIKRFGELMEEFHDLLPVYRGQRAYGAVAYLRAEEGSTAYAERKGFFVIRATGSSASITNRESFRPRVFSASQDESSGA